MERIELYGMMTRARAFELVLADLWERGLISGEMHLGTGEEAVAAGVVSLLRGGDAVALDHRATPVLTLIGVDLRAMLLEMLGHSEGLCGGMGGHMHLMSPEHLAASSGIVGAAGPLGAGFALSAKLLRPGAVAVAFFGEGAANQGMLLEAFNLAVAWSLPLLFVCKDNGWAITTRSSDVTGGDLGARAEAFGLRRGEADGLDPVALREAAAPLVDHARRGKGPGFLLASCLRADGHFLGDPMVRMAHQPIAEGGETFGKVLAATVSSGGGGLGARAGSMLKMMDLLRRVRGDVRDGKRDPLVRCRKQLRKQAEEVARLDAEAARAVELARQEALAALEEVAQ